ncbi:MAG TPA: hypothetical protein VGS19_02395 [Streptosporangiaceae bacterium]|nr:hypothetical protein [Streptosporangiaceae bacterium]
MDPELAALTSTAAATLVQLMTTDGWERAKASVGGLWRRAHPGRALAVEADLAAARQEALSARQRGDEQAELDLVGEWRSRLRRLVAANPELERELRQVVNELQPVMEKATEARVNLVTVQAKATGNSRIFQAGRDQHIVEP